MTAGTALDLLDLLAWKRRIFELYAEVRKARDPEAAWTRWRRVRDDMFRSHPQSPVAEGQRAAFSGLPYFDYDLSARVMGEVREAPPEEYDIATSRAEVGAYSFTRFGTVSFELYGEALDLELYWLTGYGGGLFLPFRDGTSGKETYGAGRYLLDTVKGSDLGTVEGKLVLDFNFAYNPSCSYDPRWVCPLAPLPNRLDVPIRSGERYDDPPPRTG